jgi:Tfp pilus assembly protein PilO
MQSLKSQIRWCARFQIGLGAIVALLVLLFYVGCYGPHTRQMNRLTSQIVLTQHDLQISQAQAQRLPSVTADLNRLRAQLADYKKLPSKSELGDFVAQINQLHSEADLHKWALNISGAPRRYDQFTEQQVTLKFEGDFLNVFNFLRQAEDMQRLTRVSSIVIHGADLKDGVVQVDLSMDLYYSEG